MGVCAGLVRLWLFEGLRLFQDRLVLESERAWTDETIDAVARKWFGSAADNALVRPVLYSAWVSGMYESVDREVCGCGCNGVCVAVSVWPCVCVYVWLCVPCVSV